MAPVSKPVRKRLRHYFREWREHRKLTQDQAIELLGWSQSKISRLESGATPYSQDDLEVAAEVYNCKLGDILSVNPKTATSGNSITSAWQLADVRPHINAVTTAMVSVLYEREAIDVEPTEFVSALNDLIEESLERPEASERDIENVVRFRLKKLA